MRANFTVMKGLAVPTCVGSEQRIKPLEEFMRDLKTGSGSRKELEWNAGSFRMIEQEVGWVWRCTVFCLLVGRKYKEWST